MDLVIRRVARFGNRGGIEGRLHVAQAAVFTLECPWIDENGRYPVGKPYKSCLPSGVTYQLEPHNGEKYKHTWALINKDLGVTHEEERDGSRFACVLKGSRATRASHLQGCVLIGTELHLDGRTPVMFGRNVAISMIRSLLDFGDGHTLRIEDHYGGYPI
jgi:hypothetical protein